MELILKITVIIEFVLAAAAFILSLACSVLRKNKIWLWALMVTLSAICTFDFFIIFGENCFNYKTAQIAFIFAAVFTLLLYTALVRLIARCIKSLTNAGYAVKF